MSEAKPRRPSDALIREAEDAYFGSIRLVASESLVSPLIARALASVIHGATIEGSLQARYVGRGDPFDHVEDNAQLAFAVLFGKNFADVQAHSASVANFAVVEALTDPGATILSMSMAHGGHLSHGGSHSIVARRNVVVGYVTEPDGRVDYDSLLTRAYEVRPSIIISGASSYPRWIDHDRISDIAHEVGAVHVVDVAHTAGFHVAGLVGQSLSAADVITMSTQKTLLGPRGGVVVTSSETISELVRRAIFPGLQSALHTNNIAAKLCCAEYARSDMFCNTMRRCIDLAAEVASALKARGIELWTDGTDNHIVMADLKPLKVSAREAERALRARGIVVNANVLPEDGREPSGLRIGLTSLAQLEYSADEAREVALVIGDAICGLAASEDWFASRENRRRVEGLRGTYAGRAREFMRWPGNEEFDYYDQALINHDARSTIFLEAAAAPPRTESFVPLVTAEPTAQWTQEPASVSSVVMPARDVDDYLEQDLEYVRDWSSEANIIVASSIVPSTRARDLAKRFRAILVDSELLLGETFDARQVEALTGCSLRRLKGKGLDVLSGILLAYSRGAPGVFLMDTDFRSFSQFRPLHQLSCASADHISLATPGRKNDSLHALADNLDLISVFCGGRDHAAEIMRVAREYIHLLAGERYISRRMIGRLPIATAYGFETVTNVLSCHGSLTRAQVANHFRPDQKNTRDKNEAIILNATRLLLALAVYPRPIWEWSIGDYADFNRAYGVSQRSSVLPQRANQPISDFDLRRDAILPPIPVLFDRGIVDRDAVMTLSTRVIEEENIVWQAR
jgi:glycine hydroxymethyltransferase